MAVRLKNTNQNISYVVLQKPETSQTTQNTVVSQPKPCMKVLKYPDGSTTSEFVIRAPKSNKRKYSLMKFEYSGNLDFNRLGDAVIQRENNLKAYKQAHDIDSAPKFGEGSEYRKEEKEEARRKKYGIRRQHYNPEDQPWILNLGAKERQKRFKGVRAGGASDNASYYIFTQCPDGAFEAFPISDWHIFKPCPKYNHLTAEEAEEEFLNRDKRLSRLSVKVLRQIRRKNDEEDTEDKEKEKKDKDLMLTEMDDWGGSDRESGDNDEDISDKKKKKKKLAPKKKSQRKNSDDEAMDDSDDGDKEQEELDYMTDTDSDDENMYDDKRGKEDTKKYEQDGVADEDGLKKLLNSDDEDEEEKPEDEENNEEEKEKKNRAEKKKKGSEELMSDSSSSSDSSDDSADSDPEAGVTSPLLLQKKKKTPPESRSATPTNNEGATNKRKAETELPPPNSKKARAERIIAQVEKAGNTPPGASVPSFSLGKGESSLNVENVRRYLMRKPMTTTELIKKFKTKNQNLTSKEITMHLTDILKKINPDKKKINEALYLSVPADKSAKASTKE